MTASATIESRLDELESRARLRELQTRYCIAADDRNMVALGELLTDDIHIESREGSMQARGRANVLAMFDQLFMIRGPSFHWTHDVILEFDPADRDRATGLVLAHAETTPNGLASIAAIRYEDVYRREGGVWRFAKRYLQFLYYMPMTEFAARFPTTKRMGIHGGWQEADYPESLPSWRAWAEAHGGGGGRP